MTARRRTETVTADINFMMTMITMMMIMMTVMIDSGSFCTALGEEDNIMLCDE
jgi:hypothetical protein